MSAATLQQIRLQLGYYGISALIVSGNIGNAFLLIMLGRSFKRHRNSCSLYLFFASLSNLLVVDTALVSTLYGLNHLEPTHASNVLCKFRWYGGHVLFMLSRCFSKCPTCYAHKGFLYRSSSSDRRVHRSMGTLLSSCSNSIALSASHRLPCLRSESIDLSSSTIAVVRLLRQRHRTLWTLAAAQFGVHNLRVHRHRYLAVVADDRIRPTRQAQSQFHSSKDWPIGQSVATDSHS